jgi:hypothetical protein
VALQILELESARAIRGIVIGAEGDAAEPCRATMRR